MSLAANNNQSISCSKMVMVLRFQVQEILQFQEVLEKPGSFPLFASFMNQFVLASETLQSSPQITEGRMTIAPISV
jgi:hypothetical protein